MAATNLPDGRQVTQIYTKGFATGYHFDDGCKPDGTLEAICTICSLEVFV